MCNSVLNQTVLECQMLHIAAILNTLKWLTARSQSIPLACFLYVILLLDDYKNRVMSDEKLRNKIVSNYYRIISGAFYSMEKFSLEVEAPRSKGFEPPNAGTKS